MKRIQCLACEYESCFKPSAKCSGAVACFEFINTFPNGTTFGKKGCIDDELYVKLQCHFIQNPEDRNLKISTKCCFTDFCNDNPIVPEDQPFKVDINDLIVFGTISVFFVAALLLFAACLVIRRKKLPTKPKCPSIQDLKDDLRSCDFSSNFYSSETSGSGGYGQPLLIARTVSKDIYKDLVALYKGRTNEVYRGTWLGNPVAIKVFNSRDEHIFQRELDVYRAINKHENILEFIAADCTSSADSCTQQWLITNYYEQGSMYDFLNRNAIDQRQCLSILRGIINGLDYLHSEDVIPEIAHRDIKSKNILMKDYQNVCIADFGLAVTYYKDTGKLINAEKYKVGTIRYMPPEILSDSFNSSSIVSHKQADIYSLSLVMWEACRRCISRDGKADIYSLPFGGVVPSDPSFEDMKKVVCDDNQRPNINTRMSNDAVISRITKIMQECWYTAPIKRLTSLRVKKSLNKIDFSL